MTVATEEKDLIEGKVKELLQGLQLDVHLSTTVEDNRLYFNVTGPDARNFLRNRDEILKSISLLMQTVHQNKFGKSDLEIRFDANGTLMEREKEVRAMAFSAADKLKQNGDTETLEPLNPYERRIVHMALGDRKNLVTESVGEGHFKRLRIRYKGPAAPAAREPEPAPAPEPEPAPKPVIAPEPAPTPELGLDDGPVSDF